MDDTKISIEQKKALIHSLDEEAIKQQKQTEVCCGDFLSILIGHLTLVSGKKIIAVDSGTHDYPLNKNA